MNDNDGWVTPSLRRALRLFDEKQLKASIKAFRSIIGRQPDNAEAHYRLAVALEDDHNLPGAIDEYIKAIRIDELNAEPRLPVAPYQDLCGFLRQKGRAQEAVEIVSKVVEFFKLKDELLYNYALALRDSGNLDTAIDYFERAVRLDPDAADYRSALASSLRKKATWSDPLPNISSLSNSIRTIR